MDKTNEHTMVLIRNQLAEHAKLLRQQAALMKTLDAKLDDQTTLLKSLYHFVVANANGSPHDSQGCIQEVS
jgi:hypothetical protein